MARLSQASPPLGPSHRAGTRRAPRGRRVWLGGLISVVLAVFMLGWWLLGAPPRHGLTVAGLQVHGVSVSRLDLPTLTQRIAELAASYEQQAIVLGPGPAALLHLRRKALGAQVDVHGTAKLAHRVGRSGHVLHDAFSRIRAAVGRLDIPLFIELDRERALKALLDLKRRIDHPPVEPHLNLDRRVVHKGRIGQRLDVYESLLRIEEAMRNGRDSAELALQPQHPKHGGRLDGLAIGHILGEFATVYSLADKDQDRAHNLGLGATRINGHVLQPGASFSFNDIVGPRSPARGYRTATVITAGELVDGMAGGACQLSSTLFAAAFFAGLDLVKSRPHTMPSSYIKMGLDAAVAFPHIDLVLRNPYEFPVALKLTVNRGKVSAAVLGPQRPWRLITFRRVVEERHPFEETTREDPALPRGVRVIDQAGVPGYRLERQRLFFRKGPRPARRETRSLRYPPTRQIVRQGTGPAQPGFVAPRSKQPFRDASEEFEISQ